MCCSIRRVAKFLEREPAQLPARLGALRYGIARLHHAQLGISRKTLQNHVAKGITDKDFELAKKIEEVVLWQPGKAGGALEGTPSDQRFAYIDYKKS